ncbi:MAG: hypothetical protein AB7V55_04075 [Oscillospiraceae bacterium]
MLIFFVLGFLAFGGITVYCAMRSRALGAKVWLVAAIFSGLAAMVCLFFTVATLLLVGGVA